MAISFYESCLAVILASTFALLHLLHLCAHLARLVISIIDGLSDRLDELLVSVRFKTRNVARDVQGMKKRPGHLAVIWVPMNYNLNAIVSPGLLATVGPHPRSRLMAQQQLELEAIMRDVLNLLLWAQEAGLREITLFDERGLLKSHRSELFERLSSSSLAERGNSITWISPCLGTNAHLQVPSFKITCKPHSVAKRRSMQINLIDRHQGHEHLAEVARELVGVVNAKAKLKIEDLNVKTIDERICATSIGPPDLLMVLGGRSLRFRGFPPWQLTLTEIYHARSYAILPYRLSYREFIEALKVFGDCEQRAGA